MSKPDPVDHALDVLRTAIAIVSEDIGTMATTRQTNSAVAARMDARVTASAVTIATLADATSILRRMKNRF